MSQKPEIPSQIDILEGSKSTEQSSETLTFESTAESIETAILEQANDLEKQRDETASTFAKDAVLSPHDVYQTQRETRIGDRLRRIKQDLHAVVQLAMNNISRTKEQRNFLEKQSPFQPGELFDPSANLAKIRQLPKHERDTALVEFKEKLAYQKRGIGIMYEHLMQSIRQEAGITFEEITKTLDLYRDQLALTDEQVREIRIPLREVLRQCDKIAAVSKEYPNDDQLFARLFGRPPVGKVSIVRQPFCLYVRCVSLTDLALLNTKNYFTDEPVTAAQRKAAAKMGGIANVGCLVGGLEKSIIASRFGIDLGTFRHEEQHMLYEHTSRLVRENDALQELRSAKRDTTEEKQAALRRYYRLVLEPIYENQTKNEILAYVKSDPDFFSKLILKKKNYSYDYSLNYRQQEVMEGLIEAGLFANEDLPLIRQINHDILTKEYRQTIDRGYASYRQLLKNEYSQEQAIGLLTRERLVAWPKVVNRLMSRR